MAKRTKKPHRARRLVLVLAALLLGALIRGNVSLQTETFTCRSAHLPEGFDGFTAAVLSDLHGKMFGKDNERLLAAVAEQSPDAIFLTGDLVDEHTQNAQEYSASLASALSAIAPTYYVTGNHEWASGIVSELKKTLRAAGVMVLSNEFVPIERGGDTVVLAGIDDPNGYADQKTPETLASEVYAAYGEVYWVLLAHRNDRFETQYSLLGADLTVSGHGHGGIWRLPFFGGLFGTQHNLFPTHTAGFYEDNGAALFVSRGLGNSPRFVPRIFNRPQVAVITWERG